MELERTLSNMEFPLCYQNVIANINLEKSNDFVKAMLNTIVNKYGSITVKNEIETRHPTKQQITLEKKRVFSLQKGRAFRRLVCNSQSANSRKSVATGN